MRKANVYMNNELAGTLSETTDGYIFAYDPGYLAGSAPKPASLTLPLQEKPYVSRNLFPFFDGLIPEGIYQIFCQSRIGYD